jgi:hypothetical protein
VAKAVSALVDNWTKGFYVTKEDFINDFNKALSDLQLNAGSAKSTMQQFVKGEPPSSKKMNSFLLNLKDDINIAAKQLDYLSAKTINIYNLFNAEVESEKKYAQRILSKAKVLQMYSQSAANDIVYVGDSFDNLDYIDTTKYVAGKIPLVDNGQLSLQMSQKNTWNSARININKSNGFLGNNHVVIKGSNGIGDENYKYVFEESPSLGNRTNISDKNPLTYFEYEAIRVRKNNQSDPNFSSYDSDEFSYIVNDDSMVNAAKGSLVNWSNHNLSEPLVLDFTLFANAVQKCNSITIMPYFASSKLVKVKEVILTKVDGTQVSVLKKPIYIGSSPENLSTESFGSYFIDKAIVSFEETEAIEARVVMEQTQYHEVDIQHCYWLVDYDDSNRDDSPFVGSIKFNPKAEIEETITEIALDQSTVIPNITNPNIFKISNIVKKTIPVKVTKKNAATNSTTTTDYNVPIKLAKESFKADRMSIGVRDISLEYNEYLKSAQIVSLPFDFDFPIESLILNLELDAESLASTSTLVSTYVSVDNAINWLRISPIQSGYSDGDEVLAFNQNIPNGYSLPGVTYYSYPAVPKEIKSVLVKIEINKNETSNRTPIIYSYTLGAKVKRA